MIAQGRSLRVLWCPAGMYSANQEMIRWRLSIYPIPHLRFRSELLTSRDRRISAFSVRFSRYAYLANYEIVRLLWLMFLILHHRSRLTPHSPHLLASQYFRFRSICTTANSDVPTLSISISTAQKPMVSSLTPPNRITSSPHEWRHRQSTIRWWTVCRIWWHLFRRISRHLFDKYHFDNSFRCFITFAEFSSRLTVGGVNVCLEWS